MHTSTKRSERDIEVAKAISRMLHISQIEEAITAYRLECTEPLLAMLAQKPVKPARKKGLKKCG
jgi:hypothetical protein